MIERGTGNLTFFTRSAGVGNHDADFKREIKSIGCTVQIVRGDVTNAEDVARAMGETPAPLRGIIQMFMVLRDQTFDGIDIGDWNAVTMSKVQETWNLHNTVLEKGLDLDFFLLFSSLSGTLGQVG
jgi:hypothetical protein